MLSPWASKSLVMSNFGFFSIFTCVCAGGGRVVRHVRVRVRVGDGVGVGVGVRVRVRIRVRVRVGV